MKKGGNATFELIIVLALVIFGLWSLKKNPTPVAPVVNNQADSVTTGSNASTTLPIATISYAQALQKYKNARIQLDKDCRANPTNSTYKNGADIMLDNRAPVDRIVKVGFSFSIKAWGFKIVKLGSATLPATWYVDCGNSKNVATILIQK